MYRYTDTYGTMLLKCMICSNRLQLMVLKCMNITNTLTMLFSIVADGSRDDDSTPGAGTASITLWNVSCLLSLLHVVHTLCIYGVKYSKSRLEIKMED